MILSKDEYGVLQVWDGEKNYGLPYSLGSNRLLVYDSSITKMKEQFFNKEKGEPFSLDRHNKLYKNNIVGGSESFCGGTYEDLKKEPDMTLFNEEREKLLKSSLFSKLYQTLDEGKTRKRRMNEYDGEYDHDKRWEISPFSKAQKESTAVKALDINIDFSFNSDVRSEEINRYGAKVTAITNVLESFGIVVRLNLQNHGRERFSGLRDILKIRIRLKDYGEYLSPNEMLKIFNANFYRRMLFNKYIEVADSIGENLDGGFGQSLRTNKTLTYKKGELNLLSYRVTNMDDNKIFKALSEAIEV
jgi:hypothetical protein